MLEAGNRNFLIKYIATSAIFQADFELLKDG
jgi:hypothetical protein